MLHKLFPVRFWPRSSKPVDGTGPVSSTSPATNKHLAFLKELPFLNTLSAPQLKIVAASFQPICFSKNSCIIRAGDPGEGCYLIEQGQIRLELQSEETDSNRVVGYLNPGHFLGECSLLINQPRSVSAYAHTDVLALWFSKTGFEALCRQQPIIGLAISKAMAQDLAHKLRQHDDKLKEHLFAAEIDAETQQMVARSVAAQQTFQQWSEERVDALLHDIATAVVDRAEELAKMTVVETGMGVVADKAQKNRFAAMEVYHSMVGRPAAGRLQSAESCRVMEIASPVGVVLGLIPVTNPVATIVFKTLICLKGRNALILSCHRNALGVGKQVGQIIHTILHRHGAPVDLVQWISGRTDRKKTMMYMKHKDVALILATGGSRMVKAAYSSGTPAIGVGSGNAPVLICADADLPATAEIIVGSKSFDNGIICGSENNLVIDASVRQRFIELLAANGAAVLNPDEAHRFRSQIFTPDGYLRREMMGKSAAFLAQAASLERAADFRLIVVPASMEELTGAYGREKLAPILSLFTVKDWSAGLSLCQQILTNQGRGHTAIIHTQSPDWAEKFGMKIPASRILINSPGSQGCIGMGNDLMPSFTLGCGTFGGTSTTDNISYTHLLNIKRLVL